MCVHPYAAWRTHSAAGRALIVMMYAVAGYTVMLAALLSF